MYLEKAKPEEFEEYYAIKCEDFNLYWTASNLTQPPRENLQKFYDKCGHFSGNEPIRKEIYFIKTDEGIIAGYMYLDINKNIVDLPIALRKEFTGKGFAKQAIIQGMQMAKQLGCDKAVVKIREDNIASMRLFIDKCAWTKTDEYVDFFSEELSKSIKMYTVYKNLQ